MSANNVVRPNFGPARDTPQLVAQLTEDVMGYGIERHKAERIAAAMAESATKIGMSANSVFSLTKIPPDVLSSLPRPVREYVAALQQYALALQGLAVESCLPVLRVMLEVVAERT